MPLRGLCRHAAVCAARGRLSRRRAATTPRGLSGRAPLPCSDRVERRSCGTRAVYLSVCRAVFARSQVSCEKGFRVILKDANKEGLGKGEDYITGNLDTKVKRRRMAAYDRNVAVSNVVPLHDGPECADALARHLGTADVVIEAVPEDLGLKHRVIAGVEPLMRADAVFATNTSAIPIADVAAGSSRPGRVIGMHYFSPVPQVCFLCLGGGRQGSKHREERRTTTMTRRDARTRGSLARRLSRAISTDDKRASPHHTTPPRLVSCRFSFASSADAAARDHPARRHGPRRVRARGRRGRQAGQDVHRREGRARLLRQPLPRAHARRGRSLGRSVSARRLRSRRGC